MKDLRSHLKQYAASAMIGATLLSTPAKSDEIYATTPAKQVDLVPNQIIGFGPGMSVADDGEYAIVQDRNDDLDNLLSYRRYTAISEPVTLAFSAKHNNYLFTGDVGDNDPDANRVFSLYNIPNEPGYLFFDKIRPFNSNQYTLASSMHDLDDSIAGDPVYFVNASGDVYAAQFVEAVNNTGNPSEKEAVFTGVTLDDFDSNSTSLGVVNGDDGLLFLVGRSEGSNGIVEGYNPLTGQKVDLTVHTNGVRVDSVDYEIEGPSGNPRLYLGILNQSGIFIQAHDEDASDNPFSFESMVSSVNDAKTKLSPSFRPTLPFTIDFDMLGPHVSEYRIETNSGAIVDTHHFLNEDYSSQLPHSLVNTPLYLVADTANGSDVRVAIPNRRAQPYLFGKRRVKLKDRKSSRFNVSLTNSANIEDRFTINAQNKKRVKRDGAKVKFFGPTGNITAQMFTGRYNTQLNAGASELIRGKAKFKRKAYGDRRRAKTKVRITAHSPAFGTIYSKNLKFVGKSRR